MQEAVKPVTRKEIIEHPQPAAEGFDLRTHIRDAETGRLIRKQPHAYHAQGDLRMYEQPIGSGNMFTPGGHPMGRYEMLTPGKKGQRWEQVSETHAPVVEQKFYGSAEEENEALRAELAALKAESDAKLPPKAEPDELAAEKVPDNAKEILAQAMGQKIHPTSKQRNG